MVLYHSTGLARFVEVFSILHSTHRMRWMRVKITLIALALSALLLCFVWFLGITDKVIPATQSGYLPALASSAPEINVAAIRMPPTHLAGPLPNSTTVMVEQIGLNPPPWCTISDLEGLGQLATYERTLLAKYVNNMTRHYWEWGSGASTLWAIRRGVSHMTSVDTDQSSLDCLLSHPDIKSAVARGALDLIYVDIDANSGGGKPDHGHFNGPQRRRFAYPHVSDLIRYHPEPQLIDAVLVDGRFRAAAILKSASVVRSDVPIFIHDAQRSECASSDVPILTHAHSTTRLTLALADQHPITLGIVSIVEEAGRMRALKRTALASQYDANADPLAAWSDAWAPFDFDFSRR